MIININDCKGAIFSREYLLLDPKKGSSEAVQELMFSVQAGISLILNTTL